MRVESSSKEAKPPFTASILRKRRRSILQLDPNPNRLVPLSTLLTIDDSFLLALNEDLVEWIVSDGMRQTLDPFVLLFFCGC